ncbi:MAG: hypothetical protein Q4C53_07725 [Clostridia bacterium]|nr:hypothetical protein [Clostridia bacterium]
MERLETLACTRCGAAAETTVTANGESLCAACLAATHVRCPECGRYVRNADAEYYDPGYCGRDILLCSACAERLGY